MSEEAIGYGRDFKRMEEKNSETRQRGQRRGQSRRYRIQSGDISHVVNHSESQYEIRQITFPLALPPHRYVTSFATWLAELLATSIPLADLTSRRQSDSIQRDSRTLDLQYPPLFLYLSYASKVVKMSTEGSQLAWRPEPSHRRIEMNSKRWRWRQTGLDFGLWTLDFGLRTLDFGLWTLDSGIWGFRDLGPGTLILNFAGR